MHRKIRDYFKGRGLSKLVISRDTIRVTPFRALITLLITYLLSPLPLQVERARRPPGLARKLCLFQELRQLLQHRRAEEGQCFD